MHLIDKRVAPSRSYANWASWQAFLSPRVSLSRALYFFMRLLENRRKVFGNLFPNVEKKKRVPECSLKTSNKKSHSGVRLLMILKNYRDENRNFFNNFFGLQGVSALNCKNKYDSGQPDKSIPASRTFFK